MLSLVFAQPFFLFGLLAAAAPVLIHLIHRQKKRRYRFSTLRFLRAADKRSARRHRLVDLLVLLLRAATLALLALALAQPLLRPSAAGSGQFGRLALAIVLDDSMSMQRRIEAVSLFDRAREAARRILAEIPQDSEAAVVLTSGRPNAELATPTSPPANLAGLLDKVECSFGGRPLAAAIRQAADIVSSGKMENRAIVVISDLNAAAFADASSLDHERLEKQLGAIYVIDAGDSDQVNLAISRASVAPSAAFPGTPMAFRAEIAGAVKAPAQTVASLWIGEEKIAEKKIEVVPGKPSAIAFEHALQDTGDIRASLRIEADSLGGDNTRYLVARMLRSVNAAIVAPPGFAAGAGDETLFLRTALNPLLAPTTAGASPVTVSAYNYLSLRPETLRSFDALFFIHDPSAPPGALAAIEQFAEAGGTAIVFPSAAMAGDPLAETRYRESGLGGFAVAGLREAAPGEAPLGFGEIEEGHPIFSLLVRSAPQLFGAVALARCLILDENRFDGAARVLARTTLGEPLLVERRTGGGAVLAFAAGCHPAWGDLPLRPLFLPLLYETLKHALGAAPMAEQGGTVDEGFAIDLPPGQSDGETEAAVVDPAGMETRLPMGAADTRLDFADTPQPGYYAARRIGSEAPPALVAVNASYTESDPRRAEPGEIKAYFPRKFDAAPEASADPAIQRLRYSIEGIPLALPLLCLAAAAFLAEAYLANALLRQAAEQPSWLQRAFGRTPNAPDAGKEPERPAAAE